MSLNFRNKCRNSKHVTKDDPSCNITIPCTQKKQKNLGYEFGNNTMCLLLEYIKIKLKKNNLFDKKDLKIKTLKLVLIINLSEKILSFTANYINEFKL
jgi:hypothetical protein